MARYRHAIRWLAHNTAWDGCCSEDNYDPAGIEGDISMLLVADIFGKPERTVLEDVAQERRQIDEEKAEHERNLRECADGPRVR